MGRLKADKRKEIIGKLTLLSQKKILSLDEKKEMDELWYELTNDNYDILSLNLRHIHNYCFFLKDKIDSVENTFKHCDNRELENLYSSILWAEEVLLEIQWLCSREMSIRNSDQDKMEKGNDRWCYIKHFNTHMDDSVFNAILSTIKKEKYLFDKEEP